MPENYSVTQNWRFYYTSILGVIISGFVKKRSITEEICTSTPAILLVCMNKVFHKFKSKVLAKFLIEQTSRFELGNMRFIQKISNIFTLLTSWPNC